MADKEYTSAEVAGFASELMRADLGQLLAILAFAPWKIRAVAASALTQARDHPTQKKRG